MIGGRSPDFCGRATKAPNRAASSGSDSGSIVLASAAGGTGLSASGSAVGGARVAWGAGVSAAPASNELRPGGDTVARPGLLLALSAGASRVGDRIGSASGAGSPSGSGATSGEAPLLDGSTLASQADNAPRKTHSAALRSPSVIAGRGALEGGGGDAAALDRWVSSRTPDRSTARRRPGAVVMSGMVGVVDSKARPASRTSCGASG